MLLSQARILPDAIKARAMQQEPAVLYARFNQQFPTIKVSKSEKYSENDCYYTTEQVEHRGIFIKFNKERDRFSYDYLDGRVAFGKIVPSCTLAGKQVKLQTLPFFAQAAIIEYFISAECFFQFKPLHHFVIKQWQNKIGLDRWLELNDVDEVGA
jgi:hypothetical protein